MNHSILYDIQVRYGTPIINALSSFRRTLVLRNLFLFSGLSVAISSARAEDPADPGGDVADTIKRLFSEYIGIALLVISAIAFLMVAWATLSKFNEARRGRADWGEVAVPFIFGAALLVFIGFLVTEGQTAATAIGGE